MEKNIIIIPSRLASSRLPNKPLADICGKTMIHRVYEQALKSKAGDVVIACDGEEIANEAQIVSMSIEDDFVERGGMISVQMGRRSFELNINHKNIEKFKTKFDPIVPSLVVN